MRETVMRGKNRKGRPSWWRARQNLALLVRLGESHEALVAVRGVDGATLVGETPDGKRVTVAVVGGLTPSARRAALAMRPDRALAAEALRLAQRSGDAEWIAAVSAAAVEAEGEL